MTTDTRELVRTTALRLFRERGYAKTTMRAIAQDAGLATGLAHYYFPTKDHLVQELYLDVNREHARLAGAVLDDGGDLAARFGACSTPGSTPSRTTTGSAPSS